MPIVVWGVAHDASFHSISVSKTTASAAMTKCNIQLLRVHMELKKLVVDGSELISMIGTTLHKFLLWTEYATIAKSHVSLVNWGVYLK
jgi:hypothetical protein